MTYRATMTIIESSAGAVNPKLVELARGPIEIWFKSLPVKGEEWNARSVVLTDVVVRGKVTRMRSTSCLSYDLELTRNGRMTMFHLDLHE